MPSFKDQFNKDPNKYSFRARLHHPATTLAPSSNSLAEFQGHLIQNSNANTIKTAQGSKEATNSNVDKLQQDRDGLTVQKTKNILMPILTHQDSSGCTGCAIDTDALFKPSVNFNHYCSQPNDPQKTNKCIHRINCRRKHNANHGVSSNRDTIKMWLLHQDQPKGGQHLGIELSI
ncbi:hypothetical protein Nepgr_030881 [Nepenthes gracilis]|uniref:Uncharacterized protein n=1 Tax=Nepenthes gracilis TaxID=150966 RepID=A0AAD3Y4N3_NEPGR|nr:hypothetical protein Nepgr_030881 [Nepenthes gracilis]